MGEELLVGLHQVAPAYGRQHLPEGDALSFVLDAQPVAAGGDGPGRYHSHFRAELVHLRRLPDECGHQRHVQPASGGGQDVAAELGNGAAIAKGGQVGTSAGRFTGHVSRG
jgi:hypothetical protein